MQLHNITTTKWVNLHESSSVDKRRYVVSITDDDRQKHVEDSNTRLTGKPCAVFSGFRFL